MKVLHQPIPSPFYMKSHSLWLPEFTMILALFLAHSKSHITSLIQLSPSEVKIAGFYHILL